MAASILDWRSRSDAPRPYGAKSDYYLGLDPPYVAKNSNFEMVEELAWVRGFENSPLMPRLHEWLTVQGVAAGSECQYRAPAGITSIGLGSGPQPNHNRRQADHAVSQYPGNRPVESGPQTGSTAVADF